MVEPRILTSSKDCLDVEVFSSFDRFISYMGYPSEEIIRNIDVVDELSNIYFLHIQDEEVNYFSSKLNKEIAEKILDRVINYIGIVGGCNLEADKREISQLIDLIVKIRGLTY